MATFLIVVPSLKKLAPIIVAIEQANSLVELGHSVAILTLENKNKNIDMVKLLDGRIRLVDSLFNSGGYDYIHTHGFRPNFIFALLKKTLFFKAEFITTVHTNVELDLKDKVGFLNFFFVFLWKFSIGCHDFVICLNKENLSVLNLGKEVATEVLPNGIDVQLGTDAEYEHEFLSFVVDRNYIYIGSACVVRHVKGIDRIIDVLSIDSRFKYVLIGDGPEIDNLKARAKIKGVYDRVLFLGYKENPTSYLRKIDVAVFPSRSEGFPLALLEAMANGLPCVVSDISAFRTFFNKELVFFSQDNLLELKDSIYYAYDRRKYFSDVVRKTYLNNFTSRKVTNLFLEFLFRNKTKPRAGNPVHSNPGSGIDS